MLITSKDPIPTNLITSKLVVRSEKMYILIMVYGRGRIRWIKNRPVIKRINRKVFCIRIETKDHWILKSQRLKLRKGACLVNKIPHQRNKNSLFKRRNLQNQINLVFKSLKPGRSTERCVYKNKKQRRN